MATGKATARTGSALEAAASSRSDVAALCLQLLVELSQRHAQMSKIFEGNIYLLRYLSNAPPEEAEKEEEEEEANVAAAIAAAMQGQQTHKGKKRLSLEEAAEEEKQAAIDVEPVKVSAVKPKKKKKRADASNGH